MFIYFYYTIFIYGMQNFFKTEKVRKYDEKMEENIKCLTVHDSCSGTGSGRWRGIRFREDGRMDRSAGGGDCLRKRHLRG